VTDAIWRGLSSPERGCECSMGHVPCGGCKEPRQRYCVQCDENCMHVGVVKDKGGEGRLRLALGVEGLGLRGDPPMEAQWPALRRARWVASLVMYRHPGVVIRIREFVSNYQVTTLKSDGRTIRQMGVGTVEEVLVLLAGLDVGLGLSEADRQGAWAGGDESGGDFPTE